MDYYKKYLKYKEKYLKLKSLIGGFTYDLKNEKPVKYNANCKIDPTINPNDPKWRNNLFTFDNACLTDGRLVEHKNLESNFSGNKSKQFHAFEYYNSMCDGQQRPSCQSALGKLPFTSLKSEKTRDRADF